MTDEQYVDLCEKMADYIDTNTNTSEETASLILVTMLGMLYEFGIGELNASLHGANISVSGVESFGEGISGTAKEVLH